MMNAWTPTTSARPAASSARNSSLRPRGDAQTALDDHEVEPEDGEQADEPQLLTQRREREVGVEAGIGGRPPTVGSPAPRPVAQQPAPRERVQRPDDLVAGAQRVRERVEPDVDARPDVVEQLVQERTPRPRTGSGRGPRSSAGRWRRTAGPGTRRRTGAPHRGRAGRRRCPARWPTSRPSARGTGWVAAAAGPRACSPR